MARKKDLEDAVTVLGMELQASAAALESGDPPEKVAAQMRYTLSYAEGLLKDSDGSH